VPVYMQGVRFRVPEQVRGPEVLPRRSVLRRLSLPQEAAHQMSFRQGKSAGVCGGWDEESLSRLYGIFREKMHEVYRRNHKVDPFSKSLTTEFNAWQTYLRDSLKLEVADAWANDLTSVCYDKSLGCWIRLMNPSNGTSHSHEFMIVPMDLAEKIITLGELPDEL
jgi:hypothetical protein